MLPQEQAQQDVNDLHELLLAVYDYQLDEAATEPLEMVPMSSGERRQVHRVCQAHGLKHKTLGKEAPGDIKSIRVSKPHGYTPTTDWPTVAGPGMKEKKKSKIKKGKSQILEWLWLGSGTDADDHEDLARCGITRVLNVTSDWFSSETEAALLPGNYKRIAVQDWVTVDLAAHFDEGIAFLRESADTQQATLVHCVVGKSRSTTMLLAFLMGHLGVSLRDAYEHTKARREIVRPNDGFLVQLQALEAAIYCCAEPSLLKEHLPPMLASHTPRTRKRKVPPRAPTEEEKAAARLFLAPFLVDQVLVELAQDRFEKQRIGGFVVLIKKAIIGFCAQNQVDEEAVTMLERIGAKDAAAWYLAKLEQELGV